MSRIILILLTLLSSKLSVRCKPAVTLKETRINKELERVKSYINFSADPCNDFYEFACGNWKNYHKVPDRGLENNALLELTFQVWRNLKELLESPLDDANISVAERKAKKFYESCVNVPNLKEESRLQFKALLDSLGRWPVLDLQWSDENFDWLNLTAQIHLLGASGLIQELVASKQVDTSITSLYIGGTDFVVVNKEDFINSSKISLMPGYKALMVETMMRFGATAEAAKASSDQIIKFETELAKIIVSTDNDPSQVTSFGILKRQVPQVDWQRFFEIITGSAVPDDITVTLFNEKYFAQMGDILSRTENKTIANYLLWRLMVSNLGEFTGAERWKVCLDKVMHVMGAPVSALYVRHYFDESIRKDVLNMIARLQDSFKENLSQNSWLDSATKNQAETKLDSISSMIGYPEYLLNATSLNAEFEGLAVEANQYYKNLFTAERFKVRKEHSILLGKDVQDQWAIQPAEVNGFYLAQKNTIFITAAILQPPVYSKFYPKAISYGTFGSFIGHELTHGFDKDGRHYDIDGNRRNWWSQSSADRFSKEAECLVAQYSNYSIPGLPVSLDGQRTLSENIADNGGLRHAYTAYENWLKDASPSEIADERIPGLNLTAGQLFFVGFAQFYCGELTLPGSITSLNFDSHSLPRFRVDGSVSNFENFADEYKCRPGSNMNPTEKCKIW